MPRYANPPSTVFTRTRVAISRLVCYQDCECTLVPRGGSPVSTSSDVSRRAEGLPDRTVAASGMSFAPGPAACGKPQDRHLGPVSEFNPVSSRPLSRPAGELLFVLFSGALYERACRKTKGL